MENVYLKKKTGEDVLLNGCGIVSNPNPDNTMHGSNDNKPQSNTTTRRFNDGLQIVYGRLTMYTDNTEFTFPNSFHDYPGMGISPYKGNSSPYLEWKTNNTFSVRLDKSDTSNAYTSFDFVAIGRWK